jgi:hypothetical protein
MVVMTTATQHRTSRIGTTASTTEPKWERRAAATGVVAAACMLGSYVALNLSSAPDSAAGQAAWYAKDGHRAALWVSWYLVALGAVFSVWFLATVRTVVRRAEGAEGRLASTAYGAGLLSVALFVVGSVAMTPVASELIGDKAFRYDPALDYHLSQLAGSVSYLTLASAGILAAGLLGAVAVATLRTGLYPRWFGIAGAVGAGLLVLTPFLGLLPVLLIPVWTIAASILTMRLVGRPAHIDLG